MYPGIIYFSNSEERVDDDLNTTNTEESTTITTFSTSSPSDTGLIVGLSVGIPIGVLLLLGLGLAYYLYRKQLACFKRKIIEPGSKQYIEQYELMKKIEYADYPRSVGERNKSKNLRPDVLPYDSNLMKIGNGGDANYINASRIDEFFIAAQDPKLKREFVFWKMVWDFQVKWIVTLTKNNERTINHGRLYNEDNNIPSTPWVHGDGDPNSKLQFKTTVKTKPTSLARYDSDLIRTVCLSNGESERAIEVFELNSWPVSESDQKTVALNLVKNVKNHVEALSFHHMIVMGKTGSGNVGVFIAIWKLIEWKEKNKELKYLDLIRELRDKREKMVTTKFQFDILQECLSLLLQKQEYSYS